VAGRNASRGRSVEERIQEMTRGLYIRTDVSQASSVSSLVRTAREQFEHLDILVCNAAIEGKQAMLHELSEEEFDEVISVNLRGTFLTMKHAIPWMLEKGGGTVVTVSSALGVVGAPQAAAYLASKGGIIQLTRAAAMDYSDLGLRINCVCPGIVDTPMTDRQLEISGPLEKYDNLLNRMATPEEIAEAILFLASPQSSFVVGSVFIVDGGKTTR
jgi:NAD(P)-dependent dehydrogenase (short-subunit alcohol dehydrogenase family)